ncbi:MAG TPA: choice-of-anchor Q domain-containing protein [Thermoleophilaceae bacterium]
MGSRRLFVLACLLALLVVPPAAHSAPPPSVADYYLDADVGSDLEDCLGPKGAPDGHAPCATFDRIEQLNPSSVVTIHLAPGEYDAPSSAPSQFMYIVGDTDATITSGLEFEHGASLSNVTVTSADDPGAPALELRNADTSPADYLLDGVTAVASSTGGPSANAVEVTGPVDLAATDSVFAVGDSGWVVHSDGADVSLQLNGTSLQVGAGGRGLQIDGGGEAALTDSTVDGPGAAYGIVVNGLSAALTLERSSIAAGSTAVSVRHHFGSGTTTANVRDSVLQSMSASTAPDDGALVASTQLSPADQSPHVAVTVTGSTLVNMADADPDHGPDGAAIAYQSGGTATIALHNTLVYAPHLPDLTAIQSGIYPAGSAAITADHSIFGTPTSFEGAFAADNGADGNSGADPLLADPEDGDFTLLAGSPAIDAGDASAVTGGESDVNGAPRSQDGDGDCVSLPDVGAFERSATLTCTPKSTPPGEADHATGKPTDTTKPKAHASLRRALKLRTALRRGVRTRVYSNEPADVNLTAELGPRSAHKLGLAAKPVVVARAKTALNGNAARVVTLKFTRKAKSKLRGGKTIKLAIRISVRDVAGNTSTLVRHITLKR